MKLLCSLVMMVSTVTIPSLALAQGAEASAGDETNASITAELETLGGALGTMDETSDRHGAASSVNALRRRGPCSRVNLDDEQKATLKEAMFEYKKERIALAADVKTTHLSYAHTVSSSATSRADAEAAGTAFTSAVDKVVTAKTAFMTKILYDILKPEQRPAGAQCLKALTHRQHRQCGHRGHHGRH